MRKQQGSALVGSWLLGLLWLVVHVCFSCGWWSRGGVVVRRVGIVLAHVRSCLLLPVVLLWIGVERLFSPWQWSLE